VNSHFVYLHGIQCNILLPEDEEEYRLRLVILFNLKWDTLHRYRRKTSFNFFCDVTKIKL